MNLLFCENQKDRVSKKTELLMYARTMFACAFSEDVAIQCQFFCLVHQNQIFVFLLRSSTNNLVV